MRFLAVYEKTDTGYSVFSPDLPGCVSCGKDLEDARRMMREAMSGHLSVMREYGESIPTSTSAAEYLDITEDEINEPTTPAAPEHKSSVRAA